MQSDATSFVSNGLGLVIFGFVAYLAIPLAIKSLNDLLACYDGPRMPIQIVAKYFLIMLWVNVVIMAIQKVSQAIPGLGPILNLLNPSWTSVAQILDLLKWVAICICILLVGTASRTQRS